MDTYVSVLPVHNDHLLLVHHNKANSWRQPGGKVNPAEPVVAGLFRELSEETGIHNATIISAPENIVIASNDYSLERTELLPWSEIRLRTHLSSFLMGPLDPVPLLVIANSSFVDLFFVVLTSGAIVQLKPNEHMGIRWFSSAELSPPWVDDLLLIEIGPMACDIASVYEPRGLPSTFPSWRGKHPIFNAPKDETQRAGRLPRWGCNKSIQFWEQLTFCI